MEINLPGFVSIGANPMYPSFVVKNKRRETQLYALWLNDILRSKQPSLVCCICFPNNGGACFWDFQSSSVGMYSFVGHRSRNLNCNNVTA